MRIFYCIILCAFFSVPVVAEDIIRIHADNKQDSAYADSVIAVTRGHIIALIGAIPEDTLDVHIVGTVARFDSLAGDFIPDWGAGVAIPHRKRIVIKSPLILTGEKSLGELVAHEYAHIALARAVRMQWVPRWLNEGFSMYMSTEWSWRDNLSAGMAVLMGYTARLAEIEKLNRFFSEKAEAAYAESYLAFTYFLDTYGKEGLRIFLAHSARNRDVDFCFMMATGGDYGDFQNEFSTFLLGRYNVLAVILDSNILWLFLALIIIIGFVINRLRRKSRMRELDEYDKLHSSDFDYGEIEKPDEDKPWD